MCRYDMLQLLREHRCYILRPTVEAEVEAAGKKKEKNERKKDRGDKHCIAKQTFYTFTHIYRTLYDQSYG